MSVEGSQVSNIDWKKRGLITGLLAVPAAMALGIGMSSAPSPVGSESAPALTPRLSPSREIRGKFPPDGFSARIREHDLVPTVFTNETFDQRLKLALSYLDRLRLASGTLAGTQLTTFGELGITHPDNYPIDFPPEMTTTALLGYLLSDTGSKRVVFDQKVTPDAHTLFAGTIGDFDSIFTRGDITHRIMFGPYVMKDDLNFQHAPDYFYRQYTDLQLGLKVIHEFAHTRQGRALLKRLNLGYINPATFEGDLPQMLHQQDQQEQERIIRIAQRPDWRNKNIAFNEAQANSISQLMLFTLSLLNDGAGIAGAHDDAPEMVNFLEQPVLYHRFLQAFFADKPPAERALNDDWLMPLHMNWAA